jgi:adenylate cyclase
LLGENYVSIVIVVQEVALALIVAAILTLAVWRARRLALAQVRASAERASLARYFSPAVVDELVQSPSSIAEVRSLDAAVLFADIVGFTRLAEQLPPEAVIAMLRDFHQRLAKAVFDHGGTVNKYIGDAIMASFGAPRPIDQAPLRAVRCAQAMVASVDAWNVQRRRRGDPEMMIAVGLHYGTVVIGDIGDERCLEFAIVGDTVNVASRLEGLCRELQASVTVSDDIIALARRESPEMQDEFDAFEPAGAHSLKGRSEPIAVHVISRPSR